MSEPKVTVKLSGPNLQGGEMVAMLRIGDTLHLKLSADDCENPPTTVKYDYRFEVLSID